MKSGFIAVLGRPNVGKSSLINALIGEKVSIVSPRAQTTRDRIMGVLTEDDYQMVFVDTPGIHKPKNRLGDYMQKCVKEAEKGADAIVLVFDAQKLVSETEFQMIEKYASIAPLYIAVNKTDLSGYEKIYPLLQRIADFTAHMEIKDVIPVSAKTKFNVDVLKAKLKEALTDTNQYFPDDEISDKPVSYMVCEIIREKALWLLSDEVPHGIGVTLVSMTEDGNLTSIDADIICERDAHKQIILGKDGAMIKEIGTRARLELEKLLDCKVFLKLFVKVRENWRNKPSQIRDAGYE